MPGRDAPEARAPHPRAGGERARWPLYALLGSLALLGLVTADALHRGSAASRAQHERTERALAGLLGSSDLALSSSSRWLRHPSQVEPAAAAADAPASLDTDPAGALLPPRAALLRQSARDLRTALPHPGVAP